MKISHLGMVTVTFLFAALLGGCCGGGTTKVENLSTTKTVGEQLLDLQKARDSGAISQEQYIKAKQDVLDKLEK